MDSRSKRHLQWLTRLRRRRPYSDGGDSAQPQDSGQSFHSQRTLGSTRVQLFRGDYLPTEDEVIFHGMPTRGAARGVMLLHGMDGTAQQYLTQYRWYGEMIAEAGFPCLACDNGGPATWGNAASLKAVSAAFAWWTSTRSPAKVKPDKVVLLGGSMGCLTAGLWAIENPAKVAAIIMVLPAIDLQDLHDNRQVSFAGDIGASIEAAYGGPAAYLSVLPKKNLNTMGNRLALSEIGVPIQIHYSTNDPIAVPSIATDFSVAVGANLQSVGANGHSGTTLDRDALRNFIHTHR